MIIDYNLVFSNGQAITTTADSTNIVDIGIPNTIGGARDFGVGPVDPELFISVTTALVGGTSINFQFLGAPDNGSGLPGTYTVFAESGPVLTASLTAGASVLRIPIPQIPAGSVLPRFYKVTYTVVGTYTSGAVFAGLVPDRQANIAYAPGVTAFL